MSEQGLIQVWSDVIPLNTVQEWYDVLWNESHWRFRGSTKYAHEPYRHWCSTVSASIFENNMRPNDISDVEEVVLNIWNTVRIYTEKVIPHLIPNKVLLNLYNHGDSSWMHTDYDYYNKIYTVIVYLNPFWDANWGGETIFMNDAKDDIIRAIYPKAGRFVMFDGRICHGPRPLSREAPVPRLGIAFQCSVHGLTRQPPAPPPLHP